MSSSLSIRTTRSPTPKRLPATPLLVTAHDAVWKRLRRWQSPVQRKPPCVVRRRSQPCLHLGKCRPFERAGSTTEPRSEDPGVSRSAVHQGGRGRRNMDSRCSHCQCCHRLRRTTPQDQIPGRAESRIPLAMWTYPSRQIRSRPSRLTFPSGHAHNPDLLNA